jgi:Tfp pilus assembly protein PilO
MKAMSPATSSRTIVAIIVVAVLAIAFWMLLLSPQHKEAAKLGKESEQLQATLGQAQGEVANGEAARRQFAANYRQLVVLGKAVPTSDESASLLVQLNGVAHSSKVTFESLLLGASSEGEAAPEPEPAPETAPAVGEEGSTESAATTVTTTVPPTEAATAVSPLGASVGPAGLSTLPYDLSFKGSFFHVADFINGIDSLIQTKDSKLAVDGRLITLDGFSLAIDGDAGFPELSANFAVTTYLVPPGEGIVGGAAPTGPEGATGIADTTAEGLE